MTSIPAPLAGGHQADTSTHSVGQFAPVSGDAAAIDGRSDEVAVLQPAKRRRGRPAGQAMHLMADCLRHHHFSYLRALVEDLDLNWAWGAYMAFEGGPSDERHYMHRARELIRVVRLAAGERGLERRAEIAFSGLDLRPPKPIDAGSEDRPDEGALPGHAVPSPAATEEPPCLDDWIEERCAASNTDPDFYSQAEWLEMYEEEFPPAPLPAIALADAVEGEDEAPSPPLVRSKSRITEDAIGTMSERVEHLNILAFELSKAPALSDSLGAWLSSELSRRFAQAQMRGKPMPLLTIDNLIGYINLLGYRWWTHVPRLGERRAQRLMAWLSPLSEQLGKPLKPDCLVPSGLLKQQRLERLAVIEPASMQRYGIVPLDRLWVPPEIDGRVGTFRLLEENTLGANNDLEAIHAWCKNYPNPRTLEQYQRVLERFYLWCVVLKRKPIGSLIESDFREYAEFLTKPPADWVQLRRTERSSDNWRPFNCLGLGEAARRLNFSIVSAFISKMVDAGYLRAHAAKGIKPSMKLTRKRMDINRSFDEGQWAWVMEYWEKQYGLYGPTVLSLDRGLAGALPSEHNEDQSFIKAALLRRTRLALELGATTGMRLVELVTVRKKSIHEAKVDGTLVWLITVLGKGSKERKVVLPEDVKLLVDRHHADMEQAGTHFNPSAGKRIRTIINPKAVILPPAPPSANATPSAVPASLQSGEAAPLQFEEGMRPLIGALQRPVKKFKGSIGDGLSDPDDGRELSDAYGSLEPNALYLSLKRFLRECADAAEAAGEPIDTAKLRKASTHWLRHFFANNAIEDDVPLKQVMSALGHTSLDTTSVYLRTEEKELVRGFSKMRRR